MRGMGIRMRARLPMMLMVCCVAGLVGSPAVVFGEGLSAGSGTGASSPLAGPLVVPGELEEAQQAQDVEEARRSNPEAVAERESSRTRFEGLDGEQATKLAFKAFPGVMDHPAGGPPSLAAGVKSLGFEAANVEQVQTDSGDVGVVQSTVPMAVASGGGHWAAVNLALREGNGGFEAQNPLVPVRLPKHLSEGARNHRMVSLSA